MAGKYPSSNDRDFNLLAKITENTAQIADSPGGGVTSLINDPGITLSAATGDVTIGTDVQGVLNQLSTDHGAILFRAVADWEMLSPGTSGQFLTTQGAAADPVWSSAGSGSGSFNGPGSATDNAIVRFNGTTGQLGQNSAVTVADTTGAMTWATGQAATLTGGDSGASLVLGSGANGVGTLSINTRAVRMDSAAGYTGASDIVTGGAAWLFSHPTSGNYLSGLYSYTGTGSANNLFIGARDDLVFGSGGASFASANPDRMRLTSTGNLLIGTTTDMASTAGGLTVAATGSGATATGVNTGGLRSANFGLSTVSGGPSYFGGNLSLIADGTNTRYIALLNSSSTYAGRVILQAGGGSATFGGALVAYGHSHATKPGWVTAGISAGSGGKFSVNDSALGDGTDVFTVTGATGAATFAGAVSVSGTTATWTSGTGSPESVKTAPVGSLYTRTDGGASTTLYVKESGAGNTGWVAK